VAGYQWEAAGYQ
jgi:hypothetical protein